MEKLLSEIDSMYSELSEKEEGGKKAMIYLFRSLKIFILAITRQKSFDFSSIRDNFRQHINNRRTTDSLDLVLLDDQLIQNLSSLKEETFKLLQKFRIVSGSAKQEHNGDKVKTFASFEEFVSFIVNQEEILNSEIWKLEAISNYLEEVEHLTPTPAAEMNVSQGL